MKYKHRQTLIQFLRFGIAGFDAHRHIVIQFLKFGTVGFIGFLFDNLLVYFGIYVLGLSKVAAGLFSFPFCVTLTWMGNRLFTFRESNRSNIRQQFMKFMSVCTVGLLFNRGTYVVLVSTVPLVNNYPVLGLLAGTAAAMFFNFFVARRVVFR